MLEVYVKLYSVLLCDVMACYVPTELHIRNSKYKTFITVTSICKVNKVKK